MHRQIFYYCSFLITRKFLLKLAILQIVGIDSIKTTINKGRIMIIRTSLYIKTLAVAILLPLILSGCETMNGLFNDSDSRSYPTNNRPVDVYENDRQAVRHENTQENRSYSITNQQGRTHHQSTADEAADNATVPVTPPSVPGVAPQLAE